MIHVLIQHTNYAMLCGAGDHRSPQALRQLSSSSPSNAPGTHSFLLRRAFSGGTDITVRKQHPVTSSLCEVINLITGNELHELRLLVQYT